MFRPYLVRSGQQEGLSFINPEMTGNVKFYNGGFQAKYGDKMSSVLDITYKRPKKFAGSAYMGLLEQGLHLGRASAKTKDLLILLGFRNRSNRNLLSSQETKAIIFLHLQMYRHYSLTSQQTNGFSKYWQMFLKANLLYSLKKVNYPLPSFLRFLHKTLLLILLLKARKKMRIKQIWLAFQPHGNHEKI